MGTCGERPVQPRRQAGARHRRQYRHRPGDRRGARRRQARRSSSRRPLVARRDARPDRAGAPDRRRPLACAAIRWRPPASSSTLGPLDILVNNAGIIRRADAVDFSEADWDEVIDVNLKAVFFLSPGLRPARLIADRRRQDRQHRLAAVLPGRHPRALLHGSKSGMAGLTKLLANEWAAKGINVNAIAPGLHRHQQHRGAARRRGAQRGNPRPHSGGALGRGRPTSAARPYSWRRRRRIRSGIVLPVDGGWLAR